MSIKRILMAIVLGLALGSVAFAAAGWMGWLDSLGVMGDERLLRSRVLAYWQARYDQDYEAIRTFHHPLQELVPDPAMVLTESFELQDLQMGEDEALAIIHVVSRVKHPILSGRTRDRTLKDRWVRYKGNWYKDLAPAGYGQVLEYLQGKWDRPGESEGEEPDDSLEVPPAPGGERRSQ